MAGAGLRGWRWSLCTCLYTTFELMPLKPLCYALLNTQSLLEEGWAGRLEVEPVCRGFLELAKALGRRMVELMLADAGARGGL